MNSQAKLFQLIVSVHMPYMISTRVAGIWKKKILLPCCDCQYSSEIIVRTHEYMITE